MLFIIKELSQSGEVHQNCTANIAERTQTRQPSIPENKRHANEMQKKQKQPAWTST